MNEKRDMKMKDAFYSEDDELKVVFESKRDVNLAKEYNLRLAESIPRPSWMFTKRVSQVTDDNLLDLVMSDLEYSLFSHSDDELYKHTKSQF